MKQGLTDITVVLDRSGSMSSVAADTIGGFNAFVKDQKTQIGDTVLTLRQFDDQHETVFEGKPIGDVPDLTASTFRPRGSTALLDAIGMAIQDVGARLDKLPEDQKPALVIMAIITDGLENASHVFTRNQVFKAISHQRDFYKWQFTFIGANQDAIAEAGAIGIPAAAALNYSGSPIGAMRGLSSNVGRAKARSVTGQSVFMAYETSERDAAMEDEDDKKGTPKP